MSDWTGLSPQWVVSWPLSELVGCYVGCKNVEFGIGVRAIKLGAFRRGGWVWENLFGEGEGSWFRQTGCSSRHPQTRSIDEDWPLALTVFSSWFSLLHQGGITSLCFTLPPPFLFMILNYLPKCFYAGHQVIWMYLHGRFFGSLKVTPLFGVFIIILFIPPVWWIVQIIWGQRSCEPLWRTTHFLYIK